MSKPKPKEVDPYLQYIQVHRSVAAMAAQLAPLLNMTYQHVRGAFDVLWESLADRRILAKALALPDPMVVLSDIECRQRLQLAFGQPIEPKLLVVAGALEPLPDGAWRVRGMSRYLETERARLAKKGGSTPVAPGSDPGATLPEPPVAPGSHPGQTPQSRELRVESRELKDDVRTPAAPERPLGPVVVTPPTSPADTWTGEDFWRWAQSERQDAELVAEPGPPRDVSAWFSTALSTIGGDVERLKEAFLSFGDDEYWQRQKPKLPFRGFMSQWNRFDPGGEHAA